jgi:hypothetical protein
MRRIQEFRSYRNSGGKSSEPSMRAEILSPNSFASIQPSQLLNFPAPELLNS